MTVTTSLAFVRRVLRSAAVVAAMAGWTFGAQATPSFQYQFDLQSVECPRLDDATCAIATERLRNEFAHRYINVSVTALSQGYAGAFFRTLAPPGPSRIALITVGITDFDLDVFQPDVIGGAAVWFSFLDGGNRLGGLTPVAFEDVFGLSAPVDQLPALGNRSVISNFDALTDYELVADGSGLWTGSFNSDRFFNTQLPITGFWNRVGVVPEPHSFALLFLGLISIGACLWRSRRGRLELRDTQELRTR